MATFFLGQRVRLARPTMPENGGAQGHITHIGAYAEGDRMPNGFLAGEKMDCMVLWDRELTLRSWSLDWVGCSLDQLEPILPDGHRAGTESFQELMDHLNTQKVERVEEVGA